MLTVLCQLMAAVYMELHDSVESVYGSSIYGIA